MTNRIRVVLSILLLPPLLIALLLVTAPDANPIGAQFATATPCATQPQIAPTFDTGESTPFTLTPTGTSDPCIPSASPTLSPVSSSTSRNLYPQSGQPTYTFPDQNGFLCDNTLTDINYTNFDNPAGLCLVNGAHHVGASGSVTGKIRLVNYTGGDTSVRNGAMWSTTRYNVINGFNTTYVYRINWKVIESINFVIQNHTNGLRTFPDQDLGLVSKQAIHIILDVNDYAGGTSTNLRARLYYGEGVSRYEFTKSANSPELPILLNHDPSGNSNVPHKVNVKYEPTVSNKIIVTVDDTYEYFYVPPAGFLDFTTANAAEGRFAGAYLGFTAGSFFNDAGFVTVNSWTYTGTQLPVRTPTSVPSANCTSLNPDTPGLFNPANSAWLLRSTRTPAGGGVDFG